MALRILIGSDHYPPFIGGAHRQTQLLGRELARRGHDVRIATVWQPGLPEVEADEGVQVHRLKQLRTWMPWTSQKRSQRHQPPFPDPVTVYGVRKLVDGLRPDVVHSYGWFTYSVAAALLGRKIPLLMSARDYAYGCATRTLILRQEQLCSGPALAKCVTCAGQHYGRGKGFTAAVGVLFGRQLLRRKVSGVHSISRYVREMVRRDLLDPAEARGRVVEAVIPSFRESGDDEDESQDPEIQESISRLPSGEFILFVGALRAVKGVNQLLEAYTRLDSPPALVLIGTVERDSPSRFPPGVVVLQDFPHRAVMAAWQRCLFGVVPSLWPEPLGSVVYEGMSKGKAMIGTTPGGHTDMITDGQDGLLVPLGDVDALTTALQRLVSEAGLRERLGAAAREQAKQFTANVAVPQFERLYHQLIAQART